MRIRAFVTATIMSVVLLTGVCPRAEAQRRIDAVSTASLRPGDVIELSGEFTATPDDQVVGLIRDDRWEMRLVDWTSTRILAEVPPELSPATYALLVWVPGSPLASNRIDITVLPYAPELPGNLEINPPTPRIDRVHPRITDGRDAVLYGEHFGEQRDDMGVWISDPHGARLLQIIDWSDRRIQVRTPALLGPRAVQPGRFEVAVGRIAPPPPQLLSNSRPLILRRTPPQAWEGRLRRVLGIEPPVISLGVEFDILGENLVLLPGETVHIDTRERLEDLANVPIGLDTRPLGTGIDVIEVNKNRIQCRLRYDLAPGRYRVGIIHMEMGFSNISAPIVSVQAPH